MAISNAEKQRREDLRKQNMVRTLSFYHGEVGYRINECLEKASNRCAAKVYLVVNEQTEPVSKERSIAKIYCKNR